jgi:pimeloyl-ACP methyl ester carboxylesterase
MPVEPLSAFHTGLGHEIHYMDWPANPSGPQFTSPPRTVVAVHGVARQCRDFDRLARRLSQLGVRVVAPSIIGRGLSSWAKPKQDEDEK